MIGFPELMLVLLIVLLVFGAKRLPEIARSLGSAVNEFKKTKDDFVNYMEEDAKKLDEKEKSKDSDKKES